MAQKYTDQQIIEAFRAGGPARERAWEFAYKDWRDKAIGTIVNRGGTREEAKEALQEAVSSFEHRVRRPGFVLHHRLSTYFVTCVFRRWARMKKKSETLEIESGHLEGFVDSVEAEIAKADLARVLDETMARLGERCKKILLLFMNGFSMREIAKKMKFSGGEQVAKNEKRKCQERYENFLREHPSVLKHIQDLRNG